MLYFVFFITPPDLTYLFPFFFTFSIVRKEIKLVKNQGMYCYAQTGSTNSWRFIKPLCHRYFSQPQFACSKSTIKTLEQGVKYAQN